MVIVNDLLYLSVPDLLKYGFSENYLKKVMCEFRDGKSSSYANIPDARDARVKLIQYSSIPAKAIADRAIPSEAILREQLSVASIETIVRAHAGTRYDQALNYFRGNPNTYPHAQELAEQSTWLLFIASMKTTQARALGFNGARPVEELCEKFIPYLREKAWKKWKCNGLLQLSRKVKPFRALFKKPLNGDYTVEQLHEALSSLVHKGFGNNNREKLGEEQEAVVFALYANEHKLNETQVWSMYLNIAGKKIAAGEWTENSIVSLSTIKTFLYRPEIKQAYWKRRHGRQAYRASYEMITHRNQASMAHAMWIIDATPWHRYYMQNGHAYARLNVVVVIDAHSWCVIGYCISKTETTEAVISALRMACERTGYLPHQIQFDNSAALKSYHAQACISAIAKYATPTQVGNARAKTIEPFFKHFNNQVLRFRKGFTHSPVMGKALNSRPNPEALQQAVKSELIPSNETQAIKEMEEDFHLWNFKPFKGVTGPIEKMRLSEKENAAYLRPFTKQVLIEAFYTMPGQLKQVRGVDHEGNIRQLQQFFPKAYQYTNEGLELQVDKKKYLFSTDDPDFNRNLGRRFIVKYDPIELQKDGLKQIYLYEETTEGIRPVHYKDSHASLGNPFLFSQALIDRKEGEGKQLHEHLEKKKLQELQADAVGQRYIQIAKSINGFVEISASNAYPKEIMNAAKAEYMEQIANGGEYRLAAEPEEQEAVEVKESRPRLNRWED